MRSKGDGVRERETVVIKESVNERERRDVYLEEYVRDTQAKQNLEDKEEGRVNVVR